MDLPSPGDGESQLKKALCFSKDDTTKKLMELHGYSVETASKYAERAIYKGIATRHELTVSDLLDIMRFLNIK